MNTNQKTKTLTPLAVIATVVFSVLTLFNLIGFLAFAFDNAETADNMLMWLCFVCLFPALGFYYAFSRSVNSAKKVRCLWISALACVVMDIVYIIVAISAKERLSSSLGVFGVDPVATCILAVFTGQLCYFVLFLMLCKSGKKLHEILAILLSVTVPFLSFMLAIIILTAVLALLVFAFMKGFVKFSNAVGAGDTPTRNAYTVNDGWIEYTLTYHQRNLTHNADEYKDQFNNSWFTTDNGTTFYRI